MKWIVLITVVLFVLLLAAGFFLSERTGPWAERELREAVAKQCATCEVSIGRVALGLNGAKAFGVKFSGGRHGGQFVTIDVREVLIRPVFSSLLSGQPRMRSVTLFRPRIVFYDGPGKSESAPAKSGGDDGLPAEISRVYVRDGSFSYIRDVKGTHAELHINSIEAGIDPDPELLRAWVRARIGDRGGIELKLQSPWKKSPLEIDTDIDLHDQNLESLSKFFEPNAGVELKGTMTKARGVTRVRGREQTAHVFAEFKDFELKVNPMHDRDEVTAFFTNLGTSIAMQSDNRGEKKKDKTEIKKLVREGGESIVSFILRGLKEAAIDITI